MSTRSVTLFCKEVQPAFAAMYRQSDGYPEGHGADLRKAFGNHEIINGYNRQTSKKYANGMGCLAAQVISHFKTGIGQIYLTDTEDRQEYNYFLKEKVFNDGSHRIWLDLTEEDGTSLYSGWLSDFNK